MMFLRDESHLFGVTTHVPFAIQFQRDVSSVFSGILLPFRECVRHEIGTEISVNGGEGKFGCVMVLTKGPDLCA